MTGRAYSTTTRVTSKCSGHGVRCALNCGRVAGGEQPEHWEGVAMENGRVVELELDGLA